MLYYHPLPNPKKQGLTRVSPISGVRSYTYCICLPRHSSNVHAIMAAWLIAARKWIECSWPSTRKTKL